jgi:hypothetical protein
VNDGLVKALLLEEAASPRAVADALFSCVTGGVPLVVALTESGAVSHETLAKYLARSEAPFLRQVAAVPELAERLPPGLCARLLAVPVRRDAITGTIDVCIADPLDTHAAEELAWHLQAPVRLVRAPVLQIEEALRRMRMTASLRPPSSQRPPPSQRGTPSQRPRAPQWPGREPDRSDERIADSRRPPAPAAPGSITNPSVVLPLPAAPRVPDVARHAHVAPPVPSLAPSRRRWATPPWGTPTHGDGPAPPGKESDPPRSGLGSEIPIPLTRRTFTAVTGGTQRPPPPVAPGQAGLGEGIPVEAGALRPALEIDAASRARAYDSAPPPMQHSFIPGPPPVPGMGSYAAYAPQLPFADVGSLLSALRGAGSRDEVLELVLTAARMLAVKVALFVVKRAGYLGWACTPEFGDRNAVQSVLVPLDAASVFDRAAREGLYLGPVRHDAIHASLLHAMRSVTRDVALVPIRVREKTAVIIVADELGDTMLATRRLEEIARAAGEAFTRILRTRR